MEIMHCIDIGSDFGATWPVLYAAGMDYCKATGEYITLIAFLETLADSGIIEAEYVRATFDIDTTLVRIVFKTESDKLAFTLKWK